jgi:branched-chain amino acid transport system ATP-binding protein
MSPQSNCAGSQKNFGDIAIIRNINLSVAQGERHALIGPNGAGKSTTFNLISGYMAPTSGSVLLNGEVISGLPPYQINRRGLSRSFQVTNVFANMSVWENALRRAVVDRHSVTRSGRTSTICPKCASAPPAFCRTSS